MDYTKIKRGRRPDLGGMFFRSAWEANVYRVLLQKQLNKEVLTIEYEPTTFVFSGVTCGVVAYVPDFRITFPDGSVEYWEVKGRETSADRTKWRRLRSHYPAVKLRVIDKTEYLRLKQQYGNLPGWEK